VLLYTKILIGIYQSQFCVVSNLLLTEREVRTGGYWPEFVEVGTERSEVQYSSSKLVQKCFIVWHF